MSFDFKIPCSLNFNTSLLSVLTGGLNGPLLGNSSFISGGLRGPLLGNSNMGTTFGVCWAATLDSTSTSCLATSASCFSIGFSSVCSGLSSEL